MENTHQTENKSKKPKAMFLFWGLALIAFITFVYFVFFTDKIMPPNNITIPDASSFVFEGLPTDDETVVATINGETVTQGQVNELINSELMSRQVNAADLSEEARNDINERSRGILIDYTLLLQAARQSDIEASKETVEANVQQIKEQFGDDAFAEQLDQLGVTEAEFTETMYESSLIDTYLQTAVLSENIEISEIEIDAALSEAVTASGGQEAFDEQIASFNMDEAAVRDSIRESLLAQKQQARVAEHIESLREQADITE